MISRQWSGHTVHVILICHPVILPHTHTHIEVWERHSHNINMLLLEYFDETGHCSRRHRQTGTLLLSSWLSLLMLLSPSVYVHSSRKNFCSAERRDEISESEAPRLKEKVPQSWVLEYTHIHTESDWHDNIFEAISDKPTSTIYKDSEARRRHSDTFTRWN